MSAALETSHQPGRPARAPGRGSLLVKVPELTILFWVAKLATTAFGEAFSDFVFFNDYLGQHLAILLGLGFLALCLTAQLSTRRYVPWVYWLTVTAVSIFGTMGADFLNKDLGMSLVTSTSLLLLAQLAVFATWWRCERTLDVHAITTRRREAFYWLTVLLTFALGTAAGDFVATTLGLGSLASAFVFLAVIAVPLVAWRRGLSSVLAFWFAYSMTRPLGASFADWLGVPAPYGDGLQLGTGTISVVAGAVLLAVVAVVAHRHHAATRRSTAVRELA